MKKSLFLIFPAFLVPLVMSGQLGKGYSLEDCKKMAIQHNQKIKIADEQAEAAADLKKAAFAQYLPNFSVNGTYTGLTKDFQLLREDKFLPVVPYSAIDQTTGKLNTAALADPAVAASTFVINPLTGKVVTDASGNPVFKNYTYLPASQATFNFKNVYMGNAGFTQPVFMGGKIVLTNRIAKFSTEIAKENRVLAGDDLNYAVEEAYWRVISLKEKVKLSEEYKTMLDRLVGDLGNYKSEGLITANDLLKAQVKLSEAGLMKLKASNGLELSKMALCQLTGIEYSEGVAFTDSLSLSVSVLKSDSLPEFRLANRPEIRILSKSVDIAEAGVGLMKSRYLPNIALSAGFMTMNPNPYRGFAEEFGSDWTVGVVCSVPIFHFGDKLHTLKAAMHEKEIASLKLSEAGEMITLQVRQSEFRYKESAGKTDLAALTLQQAGENLKITGDNFAEGRLKTTDLLEAQTEWQKAYSELIDAKTEQLLSFSSLKKVKGIH
jgi:outer membrane protein